MGARLKDVAERAGVSVKTVSNVVNDYPHVSDEMRSRVRQALDELNYRPNLSARNLRRGRSGILALAVPRLDEPYFAELAALVIQAAEKRSFTVLVDETEGRQERERLVLAGIRPQLIDGVILSPIGLGRADLRQRVDETPLVLLGERVFGGPFDHVAIDNVRAARAATEHLLAAGRRRIAAVGQLRAPYAQTARLRLRGYADALRDADIAMDDALVAPVKEFRRPDGKTAVRRLFAAGQAPDALFCFNDLLASGAMRALYELGVRVPDDVAVVGFDDIAECRYGTPSLTSVAPDKEAIAALAVDALLERIGAQGQPEPRELRAGFTLAVRESSRTGPTPEILARLPQEMRSTDG